MFQYFIIPDLIDAGVDSLNISQPNLYSIEELGANFSDSVCFVCPVSYHTTSINGNRDEIYGEVKRMIDCLGHGGGGFVGYLEEYKSVALVKRTIYTVGMPSMNLEGIKCKISDCPFSKSFIEGDIIF